MRYENRERLTALLLAVLQLCTVVQRMEPAPGAVQAARVDGAGPAGAAGWR